MTIMRPFLYSLLCVTFSTAFVPISFPNNNVAVRLSSTSSISIRLAAESSTTISTDASSNHIEDEAMEEATVHEISIPSSGQKITLIGTAHLSKQSNAQVERIIESIRPDVVAVELDENRIERIGFKSLSDIGISEVVTAADIPLPEQDDNMNKPWWQLPQAFVQDVALNAVAQVARKLLTGMYNGASEQLDSQAGGEFLAAIEACKKYNIGRLVLADRDSTETIKRTAKLAFDSGDFFGFLNRLEQVNEEELNGLKEQVIANLPDNSKDDEGEITVAMMEALKADTGFRTRLFDRLEREVPEFTSTFVKERDYIMSVAISRELDRGAKHVVGVVGLAHVRGMKTYLEEMMASKDGQ